MLLLPALYIGLIVGVGYLLFLHATVNVTPISQMRSWYATVFLCIGPLVIVPTSFLVFHPAKALLFARRSRRCRCERCTWPKNRCFSRR